MEQIFKGKVRRGVHRAGRRVYLIFEFDSEYEAIQAFDVWSMEEIEVHSIATGPVAASETDSA